MGLDRRLVLISRTDQDSCSGGGWSDQERPGGGQFTLEQTNSDQHSPFNDHNFFLVLHLEGIV